MGQYTRTFLNAYSRYFLAHISFLLLLVGHQPTDLIYIYEHVSGVLLHLDEHLCIWQTLLSKEMCSAFRLHTFYRYVRSLGTIDLGIVSICTTSWAPGKLLSKGTNIAFSEYISGGLLPSIQTYNLCGIWHREQLGLPWPPFSSVWKILWPGSLQLQQHWPEVCTLFLRKWKKHCT